MVTALPLFETSVAKGPISDSGSAEVEGCSKTGSKRTTGRQSDQVMIMTVAAVG
jgi:hypothetical protein